MDIKDIMGIKGDTKGAAKKTKGVSEKKPEGVSREVWQITKGRAAARSRWSRRARRRISAR